MTKNEVIRELQYYQMYMGEIISCYYFNEAICDLVQSKPSTLFEYKLCLPTLTGALKYKQQTVAAILLCRNDKSKSIPKSIDRILSEKIIDDMLSYQKIKAILHKINERIDQNNDNILELKTYRDKVYAHFEQPLFDENWQVEFKEEHNLDFTKLITLFVSIFNDFSKVLVILGAEPYENSLINLSNVDAFLDKIK